MLEDAAQVCSGVTRSFENTAQVSSAAIWMFEDTVNSERVLERARDIANISETQINLRKPKNTLDSFRGLALI